MHALRGVVLAVAAVMVGCTDPVSELVTGEVTSDVTMAFSSGSFIIPMDTGNVGQNNGMLRAYGLVHALLRQGIPVYWAVNPAKAANGDDFTLPPASLVDVRTGAMLPARNYRGGPFLIASTDAAAALPVIQAWQATVGDFTTVHRYVGTISFNPDIARTLVAAPRIAVFKDGNETIIFNDLNAAGIPDALGNAWSSSSPDVLSEGDVIGGIGIDDGALLVNPTTPRRCVLMSAHYNATANTNLVVGEVRAWLDASNAPRLVAMCQSITTFENSSNGLLVSNGGISDDGAAPTAPVVRVPADPRVQLDGTFQADTGAVDSFTAVTSFKAGASTLINDLTAISLNQRIALLVNSLDGDPTNGGITYLAGHDYALDLPISTNPLTNGVRLILDSTLDTGCVTSAPATGLTMTVSAPALVATNQFTYTVSYTNGGAVPAEYVRVQLPLPAGTTFVSATDGGTLAGSTVKWGLGTIPVGESQTFTVTLSATTDGTYPATASFSYATLIQRTVATNTASVVRDATPPDTLLLSSPPSRTNQTAGTFTFSSEANATFQCRVDLAAWTPCSGVGSHTTGTLTEGTHTFEVRATDQAGNTDPTPASTAWFVDLTPPTATLTGMPASASNSVQPTFTFSSEPGATFQCRFDTGTFAACSSPFQSPTALVDGSHTFYLRATDLAGNTMASPITYTWTIDTAPPDTFATTQTPAYAASTTFMLTSDETATFQCNLDGGGYVACPASYTTPSLADGPHTLNVRAVDLAGNIDPTPVTINWVVDLAVPDTMFISTPTAITSAASGAFEFGATKQGCTFECSLDSAAFVTCSSPYSTGPLADGAHTLAVRATDTTGHTDPTPASFTWTSDATAPDTTIDSAPADSVTTATSELTFSSPDSSATFECNLDGTGFGACTSPYTTPALAAGSHSVEVRARDVAGNVDATPATAAWTITAVTPPADDSGCGCQSTSRRDGLLWIGVLGLVLRRRRRR